MEIPCYARIVGLAMRELWYRIIKLHENVEMDFPLERLLPLISLLISCANIKTITLNFLP
jgi:hypothetical protein